MATNLAYKKLNPDPFKTKPFLNSFFVVVVHENYTFMDTLSIFVICYNNDIMFPFAVSMSDKNFYTLFGS